jgi:mono/diheme cytochrome c family protein
MFRQSIGVAVIVATLSLHGTLAQDTGAGGTPAATKAPAQSTEPSLAPSAPSGAPPPPFPLDDPERIEKGRLRFGALCAAYCHGFEGSGGKTPAFRGRQDLTAEGVFKTITDGRTGADVMPAWGSGFSEEKRWELVAYIMYLTRQPPK